MENWSLLLHTGITIVGIVAMVVWARINPVIALVVGALYLGLATGLGYANTTSAVTEGFGLLMAEVGLIIGFGVLLGSLLSATGTLQRVVNLLLRLVGAKRSPYALGLSSGIVFPSIYFDVALVMLAPMARSIAARSGRSVAPLAGSLAIGLEVALLFVLPGAAALAIAGTLDVALGTMLLWGVPIGAVAIIVSVLLHTSLMSRTWNPEKDEDPLASYDESTGEIVGATGHLTADAREGEEGQQPGQTLTTTTVSQRPLGLMLLPVLVPVILIVVNTVTDAAGAGNELLAFLGNPVVALLIGLVLAIVLTVPELGRDGVEEVISARRKHQRSHPALHRCRRLTWPGAHRDRNQRHHRRAVQRQRFVPPAARLGGSRIPATRARFRLGRGHHRRKPARTHRGRPGHPSRPHRARCRRRRELRGQRQ